MRTTGLGALIGAGLMLLAIVAIGQRNEAAAQRPAPYSGSTAFAPTGAGSPAEASGELITFTSAVAENRQQLTIIDPKSRVMAVYHIDPTSGVATLKSVRNFQWDLLLSEFNATNPLPREIRSMIEKH
jgi:hypothetical protein